MRYFLLNSDVPEDEWDDAVSMVWSEIVDAKSEAEARKKADGFPVMVLPLCVDFMYSYSFTRPEYIQNVCLALDYAEDDEDIYKELSALLQECVNAY